MKKKLNLLDEIFYKKEYVKLYLDKDDEIFEFSYNERGSLFYNIAIKRKIKGYNLDQDYYDLETVYGYGGYVARGDKKFLKKALFFYKQKCLKENIVAEFIRFHPYNDVDISIFDFSNIERLISIKKLDDEVESSYKSKIRNIIKNGYKKLDVFESKDIDTFIKLYYETMDKNKAKKFYYFKKEYFNNLIKLDGVKLYTVSFEKEIISMGFFIFNNFAYYHLSANSKLSYKLNANYVLLDFAFKEAKKRGIKYFILGGGYTSNEEDSLFLFKKKFASIIKPFFIGGIVFNKKIYNYLNEEWKKKNQKEANYFLKYRF